MNDVVADTHAIVWYLSEPHKLTAAAYHALEQAEQQGKILISTITLVELTYPIERRRVQQSVMDELRNAVNDTFEPIDALPLTTKIANDMEQVPRNIVHDMPDRIIAATAFSTGLELVTADARIRALPNVKTIW